jgi:hypothetical protein
MAHENPYFAPEPESVDVSHRRPLLVRLSASLAVACFFVLIMYPWGGTYYPEGNWLRGPLWLFKTHGSEDKVIGSVATVLLLPLLFAWVVNRNPLTILAAVAGAISWIGFGMWLAAMAVV